jgi:PBP1b-binding outer membrane lipoprotein LpoB
MKRRNLDSPFFQELQKTYNPEVIAHQRIVRKQQDAVGIQKQAEVDSRLPDPAIAKIRRDLEQIINDGKK